MSQRTKLVISHCNHLRLQFDLPAGSNILSNLWNYTNHDFLKHFHIAFEILQDLFHLRSFTHFFGPTDLGRRARHPSIHWLSSNGRKLLSPRPELNSLDPGAQKAWRPAASVAAPARPSPYIMMMIYASGPRHCHCLQTQLACGSRPP